MPERESTVRTLAVAATVAFVCSLLVSGAVAWLRPIQLAYRSVEQNRAVLVAAGLAAPGEVLDDRAVVARFLELEPRLVDLDAGRYVNADAAMIAAYDFRAAADDPVASREIAPERDTASLGQRPLLMPVYLREEGGRLEAIVLPVYGRGMWATIHGYLVLDGDLQTVANVLFYEHGETPGIGDRIQNPGWIAQWAGKRAIGSDGTPVLRVGSGNADAAERVDAITGATITVNAVDGFVRYWLGADGYGPFLSALRSGS
jgi:Na+-transporting NADH:ubiquinone oxidoreductase subunit C